MSDESNEATPNQNLDTQGLLCPLPVIRTQEAIKQMVTGSQLTVTASDPGTMHDIPAWCRVHGHELLNSEQNDRLYTFTIRVN